MGNNLISMPKNQPHNNQIIADDIRADRGRGSIVSFGGGGKNGSFLSNLGVEIADRMGHLN